MRSVMHISAIFLAVVCNDAYLTWSSMLLLMAKPKTRLIERKSSQRTASSKPSCQAHSTHTTPSVPLYGGKKLRCAEKNTKSSHSLSSPASRKLAQLNLVSQGTTCFVNIVGRSMRSSVHNGQPHVARQAVAARAHNNPSRE